MRLRWAWMTIVIAACVYILACAYAPPESDTAAVDTSGVELAPAEPAVPASRGVAASAKAEAIRLAGGLANAVTGKVPARRKAVGARTTGGGFLSPDIVPGCCCCDPCCCDPCCCDPCAGGGGGRGGGGPNYLCAREVQQGTETDTSTCNGSDSYELEYSDSIGTHDTGLQIFQQMECSPYETQTACLPPVLGTNPGSNGVCGGGPFQVHAPFPNFTIFSSGGMMWSGNNTSFLHQTGYCDQGTACEYDNFSNTWPGQTVSWNQTLPVCN